MPAFLLFVWELSFGTSRSGTLVRKFSFRICLAGSFACDRSLGHFRFASDLSVPWYLTFSIGNFAWKVWDGDTRFETLVWNMWIRKIIVQASAGEFSLGSCRLTNVA